MDELKETLRKIGYDHNIKLSSVIAYALQDGQYSAESREIGLFLLKYESEYGNLTIKNILNNK